MTNVIRNIVQYFNYFILLYFLAIGSIYILLSFLSFYNLKRYLNNQAFKDLKDVFKLKKYKSISLIVPAYNEEAGIYTSLLALLQIEYPEYKIIVVNDGSKDQTLNILKEKFNAVKVPYLPFDNIPTEKVNAVYICKNYKNLVIVDKQNGGKADAINVGINISDSDLIIVVDADSIIERDSLLKMSYPFVENENVIAVGGTVRIANGCQINKGYVTSVNLPKSWLAKFQVVEYIRAFMFGRNGFQIMDGILIISGAFSCFKRNELMKVNGFLKDCIGEDMEIIVRMHRLLRKENPKALISFIPDPVCWTEAPENIKILGRQRKRWQKGTIVSLMLHKQLFFNPRYRLLGMIVFPYFVFFEMFGPIIETIGYIIFFISLIFGMVSLNFALVLFSAAILYGVVLSLLSVILEELTFRKYERVSQLIELFIIAVFENFGYRQLTLWYRFMGSLEYLLGDRKWGHMEKKGFSS
ncbi:MAG: glycosyltransferase [Ignavibacteriales bacterium]|nr:glycosyltransferase [Ignavibacteriales bacterium]